MVVIMKLIICRVADQTHRDLLVAKLQDLTAVHLQLPNVAEGN